MTANKSNLLYRNNLFSSFCYIALQLRRKAVAMGQTPNEILDEGNKSGRWRMEVEVGT